MKQQSDITQMSLLELHNLKTVLISLRDDYFNELSSYDSRYLLDERNLTPHLRKIIEKKRNVDEIVNKINNRIEELVYENFIK